jgi:hypothetical protein
MPNTKCPQNFHRKAKKNRALERYKARDQRRSCKIVKLKSDFFTRFLIIKPNWHSQNF